MNIEATMKISRNARIQRTLSKVYMAAFLNEITAPRTLNHTKTRVTLRDGNMYEHDIANATSKYVGQGKLSHLEPSHGYTYSSSEGWTLASSPSPSTEEGGDGEITLMSYNVWFAEEKKEERTHVLLGHIETHSPELVALQEMTPDAWEIVLASEYVRSTYVVSDGNGLALTPYGVVWMVSKTVMGDVRFEYLPLPSNMGRRACILHPPASSQWGGMGTAHLESMDNHDLRMEQAEIIRSHLVEMAKDKPVLFVGDTNVRASHAPRNAHLCDTLQPLQDAYDAVDDPEYTSTMVGEPSMRIDRLFASPTVHISSLSLLYSPPSTLEASDHHGLLSHLHLS